MFLSALFKRHIVSLMTLLLGILVLGGVTLIWAEPAPKTVPLGGSLDLELGDLGDPEGYTLKTVKTQRIYHFTRPKGWSLQPETSVNVTFQHSPSLLPERSSLNVLVNNRILKTISLGDANVTATSQQVPIPVDILKDHNTLAFQVDQHYTYKCEDPFSGELWTTLLPETTLHLAYKPQAIRPNLAHFPYPFFDTLNYGKTAMGYLAPEKSVSDQSLEALAVTATLLGQHINWRETRPFLANGNGLDTNENLIIVGTPTEISQISRLSAHLPVSLKDNRFYHPESQQPLAEGHGVLQLINHPTHSDKAILIVSGNTPEGVLNAARLLAQYPSNQLLEGNYAIVEEQGMGSPHPFRAWEHYTQQPGITSFAQLGMKTKTSRGITAPSLFYTLRKMPDLWIPGKENIRIKTVYSYSSQLDPTQSKLEVRLNGKPLASRPLDNPEGENQAEFNFEIPSPEFFTYNDLEYKFHLFPKKFDACHFVTDVHTWGTVHNATTLDVSGQIKAPLPDVGLLNDGAFPFAIYQDWSQLSFVLPENLKATDLDTLINVATRFGRNAKSRTGINLSLTRSNRLTEEIKKNNHLIVIGSTEENTLFKELESKTRLLIQSDSESRMTLSELEAEGRTQLASLNYTPDQGIVEELLSPWNNARVVLLITGKTAKALKRSSQLFGKDLWFNQIQSGNLLVVNQDGPKSLTFLKKGDARFIRPEDYSPGPKIPSWVWVIFAIFAFLGFLSVFRFFFSRRSS